MKKIIEIKFGSHLYGTDTPQSDLDLKSVYIPSETDILLGSAKHSISNKRKKNDGEKNLAGEIDEECYSLQRYMQLLSEGQTVALDMLFAPPQSFTIIPSHEWMTIIANRHKLISRKSASFVGYCRQQANKYGIKGSRVAAVRAALDLLHNDVFIEDPSDQIISLWSKIEKCTMENDHMEIVSIMQPNGIPLQHWVINGRKFAVTSSIKQVRICLQKMMDNYGKRALLAEQNDGVDWKALSHAVRVARQAIELLKTGHITFPLVHAKHILAIKLGKISYQDVSNEIENLLDEVESASNNSTLPDHPDYYFIDRFVESVHRDAILKTNDVAPIC
jgi:hypothetical protein